MSHDLTGKSPEQQETIQLLQATVEVLETIITKLNTNSSESFPSKAAVANLLSKSSELAASLNQKSPSPVVKKTLLQEEEVHKKKKSTQKKPWAIIGLVLAAGCAIALFFSQPQPQLQSQLQPTPSTPPVDTITETKEEKIETNEEPVEKSLPVQPVLKTPVVAKEPPLIKVPEHTLIAAIQNEVATIANAYSEGLIASVQADFRGGRLLVSLGDDWSNLDFEQKQKIANEILERAQKLDFRKLELTDLNGNLRARSPVVGQNMVILPTAPSSSQ